MEWKLRHGEGAAKKVNRLPPRNLRGRWGSQDGAETYLIRAGRTQTTDVFQFVFSASTAASSSTVNAGRAAAGEMVLWDEGQEEYKQRMGKWVADSIAALLDVDWWFMLHISHQVAQPVYHFGNFLISGTDSSKPALLVQLVADKALQVLREMGQLLEDGAIDATWLPLLQRVDPSLTEIPVVLVERIVRLTLEEACDFSKRVDVPVQQCPMVIVWLVLRPAMYAAKIGSNVPPTYLLLMKRMQHLLWTRRC